MGKRTNYPEMPRNYFDNETVTAFLEFRERALREPGIDLLSSFPAVAEEKLVHVWREFAVQIYTNWLSYLMEQRASIHYPPKSEVFHNGSYRLRSDMIDCDWEN